VKQFLTLKPHLLQGLACPEPDGLIPAAVLVAIAQHDEPSILLTLRSKKLRMHSGQVAFPGGRIDDCDAGLSHAALREAEEEVGITPSHVSILGAMPSFPTFTGFRMFPVVGTMQSSPVLELEPAEVEEAFWLPVSFMMDHQNYGERKIQHEGKTFVSPVLQYEGYEIWGATARVLVSLRLLLERA